MPTRDPNNDPQAVVDALAPITAPPALLLHTDEEFDALIKKWDGGIAHLTSTLEKAKAIVMLIDGAVDVLAPLVAAAAPQYALIADALKKSVDSYAEKVSKA